MKLFVFHEKKNSNSIVLFDDKLNRKRKQLQWENYAVRHIVHISIQSFNYEEKIAGCIDGINLCMQHAHTHIDRISMCAHAQPIVVRVDYIELGQRWISQGNGNSPHMHIMCSICIYWWLTNINIKMIYQMAMVIYKRPEGKKGLPTWIFKA